MKPTNDTKSFQKMKSTTSMLVCEIVKIRKHFHHDDSLSLTNDGGGGKEIKGVGLYTATT